MQIDIVYGVEGAKNAKGITVIIDVYRAASVAAYALGQGAQHIIPVATKEEAFELKKENPHNLLMGEENGLPIDGFDFGNSPYEITTKDLTDTVLVHRSSQGTQGLVQAVLADEVIFGSFPTASAIASYITQKNPAVVSLVAMDGNDSEDDVFAQYLRGLLQNQHADKKQITDYLRNHETSARFLDAKLSQFPAKDIDYCLDIDRFNFICVLQKEDNQLKIVKRGWSQKKYPQSGGTFYSRSK